MTEHLNKHFQTILNELNIKPKGVKDGENFVFHSIRSTATTYKLRVSGGDIKAVQGENGQKDPKMVTHQYSRILDEDRQRISRKLDDEFYGKKPQAELADNSVIEILAVLQNHPDILNELLKKTQAGWGVLIKKVLIEKCSQKSNENRISKSISKQPKSTQNWACHISTILMSRMKKITFLILTDKKDDVLRNPLVSKAFWHPRRDSNARPTA